MTDNVVKFYSNNAAKNPDNVLEQACGVYDQVMIIGYNKEGSLDVRASTNFKLREMFFAIDAFKFKVLNGDYEHYIDKADPE